MALNVGKILMAYRPLYLRGLLMDGQYRMPVDPPAPPGGKKVKADREVVATRTPATPRALQGVRA